MRTIKFRGKSLRTGEWLFGDLHHEMEDMVAIRTLLEGTPQTVDETTVGLFTGLHDCNGKEIYEGDIIKDGDYIFEVYWCDSLASFMHEEYNSKSDAPKIFMMDCISEDAEIVGNIHEQSKSYNDEMPLHQG